LQWVESYSRRYGIEQIKAFSSGFGNFASPDNPFMSGKIAMVLAGSVDEQLHQSISARMQYGVTAWPATKPGLENFTLADADLLTIPRGAKHPNEAWEFIKFVGSMNPTAQRREDLRGGSCSVISSKKTRRCAGGVRFSLTIIRKP